MAHIMASAFSAIRTKSRHLSARDICFILRPGQPPVTFADLATMLELEIVLGRQRDFRKRLDHALTAAYRLGKSPFFD